MKDSKCDMICPVCGAAMVCDEELGVCYCPVEYCSYKCTKCFDGR